MNLIDRESLLEKIQFRIEPFGVVGATIKDCVEKIREIILAEPVATENNVGGKWIPVTERLPINDNLILCYGGGFCMCAFFKGKFNDFDENGYPYEVTGITHWMPLPEPPKEVE